MSHLQTQFIHQEQRMVPATDSSYSGDLTEKYFFTSKYAFHIGRVYAISAYVGGVWAVRLFSRSFLKLDVSFHSFTPLINNILLTPLINCILKLTPRQGLLLSSSWALAFLLLSWLLVSKKI